MRQPRKPFPTTVRTLGDRIYAARFAKGMTQRQLAAAMQVTPQTLRAWESDVRPLPETKGTILARLLDLTQ